MLKDVHKRLNIKYDYQTFEAARRGHSAEDEEVNDFDNQNGDGPTLDPLKPYWPNPKAPWNAALGELVVSDIVARNPQFAGDKSELLEIFMQRIKTMTQCIDDRIGKPGESKAEADVRIREQNAIVLHAKRIQARQQSVSHLQQCPRLALNLEP